MKNFPIIRRGLLVFWSKIHNVAYHEISALSSEKDFYPKHRIIDYKKYFLENISENDRVLDVGCSNGYLAREISSKAEFVLGVDINEKNIKKAKEKYDLVNLKFALADATSYDFEDKFDVIILSNVLEHIENRVDFLKKMKRLATKILIRVPLITRDWISVYKKDNNLSYKLDNSHFIEYTEEEFVKEIEDSGLKIISSKIMFGELYGILMAVE